MDVDCPRLRPRLRPWTLTVPVCDARLRWQVAVPHGRWLPVTVFVSVFVLLFTFAAFFKLFFSTFDRPPECNPRWESLGCWSLRLLAGYLLAAFLLTIVHTLPSAMPIGAQNFRTSIAAQCMEKRK